MRITLFGTRGSVAAPGRRPRATAATPRPSRCTATTARCSCSTRAPASAGSAPSSRRDQAGRHPADPPAHGPHPGPGLLGPLYNPAIEVHVWGPGSSTLSLRGAPVALPVAAVVPGPPARSAGITCTSCRARRSRSARSGSGPRWSAIPTRPSATGSRSRAGRDLPARPRAGARPQGRPLARAGVDLGLRPCGRRRSPYPMMRNTPTRSMRAASGGGTAPTAMPSSSPRASAPRRWCCSITTHRTTTRCWNACWRTRCGASNPRSASPAAARAASTRWAPSRAA